jgi:NhaA family Na+:H+ antiporter
VPVATDIAFALAALAVLAPGADPRLRIFLLTLAVVDDLVAILLIAFIYSSGVSWIALSGAASIPTIIWFAQKRFELPLLLYPASALAVWAIGLESGVHTSVLAVATALATPMISKGGREIAERLEHSIHPPVAFGVLPVFAFMAAGVSLLAFDVSTMLAGAPLGIIAGLAIGKPLGVLAGYLIATRIAGANPFPAASVLAIGSICGIGLTAHAIKSRHSRLPAVAARSRRCCCKTRLCLRA